MADLTGRKRFAHLYRRAGFGASAAELDAAMALNSNENTAFTMAVDKLLNYAAVPEVDDRFQPDETLNSLIAWWLERMARTKRPLLEKLCFFWHDHFATAFGKDGIDVPKMKRQNEFFRANALGNFQDILNGISRDPAMILWLDLNSNRKNNPNENYARELQELFSIGIGDPDDPNYSENDVKQATRAFTGYTIGPDGNFFLNLAQHDPGTKTVLGQSCESGDQVNAILVNYTKGGQNVCARFIAAKLFSFLAYPAVPDDAVVTSFATTFASSGHSIRTLVRAILTSDEFSSNTAYRALIKTPVQVAVGALRILGAERVPANGVLNRLNEQGQRLFDPPDVGGWPYGRAWINAGTVLSRSNMAASIVNSLGKPLDTDAGGQPVATLLNGIADPAGKVDRVLGLLVDGTIPSAARDALIAYAGSATTDERIRGLFNLVMAQPAFQLG